MGRGVRSVTRALRYDGQAAGPGGQPQTWHHAGPFTWRPRADTAFGEKSYVATTVLSWAAGVRPWAVIVFACLAGVHAGGVSGRERPDHHHAVHGLEDGCHDQSLGLSQGSAAYGS